MAPSSYCPFLFDIRLPLSSGRPLITFNAWDLETIEGMGKMVKQGWWHPVAWYKLRHCCWGISTCIYMQLGQGSVWYQNHFKHTNHSQNRYAMHQLLTPTYPFNHPSEVRLLHLHCLLYKWHFDIPTFFCCALSATCMAGILSAGVGRLTSSGRCAVASHRGGSAAH